MGKKTIKIFLDSNVILSGLLSEKGSPRIILDILCLGLPGITGVTGRYNLIEIERNITKKMPDILSVYNKYLPKLNLMIVPLPSAGAIEKFSGYIADKDVPVLVSAIVSNSDFLVTGDKKDFGRIKGEKLLPLKIVNPSELLDEIAWDEI
jgi:predicted nucleic acid-binding protein